MKPIYCVHGSAEWHQCRAGIPTASEFHKLVTPVQMKICSGKGAETYRRRKLAERWLGYAIEGTGKTWNMDQGNVLETKAIPTFCTLTGLAIMDPKPGFITVDTGRYGATPDAVTDNRIPAEIKSPGAPKFMEYVLGPDCPTEHYAQVQGEILVCEVDYGYFMPYSEAMPTLVAPRKIPRDDEFIEKLLEAFKIFDEEMAKDWERLCKLNGGPPEKPQYEVVTDSEGREVCTLKGIDPDAIDRLFGSEAFQRLDQL